LSHDIEDVPFWSFMTQLPLDARRIATLLTLPAAQRAVFGLVTQAEYDALARDPLTTQLLNLCRLGRPFP
jgi:hypothetical protein